MVTGALFLMLLLMALLLAASIYQIVTTPLTAVDAPTVIRSAAAAAAAPELPVRLSRVPTASEVLTATGPAHRTTRPAASHRLPSWSATALTIAGLTAVVFGGWLFLHIAHGAAACSRQAIEVCSQGFVLLTGTQLAGAAIAVAGMSALVTAIVLALR
jgi:hypothetical protein